MTKIWISQEWKEFFQLNKSIFIVFEGLSFGKKMIKITDWSFKHIAQDLLRTNIAIATKRSVLN